MYYNSLLTLLMLGNILPEPLDNYSIIIIPISQGSRTNSKLPPILSDDRIDIEEYEEPTELPDIDNFDYSNDREGNLKEDKNKNIEIFQERTLKEISRKRDTKDRSEKNSIIRYLVGRSDDSKHFAKDDEDENNESNIKKARSLELYDNLPMTYDYDQHYGENKIVGGTEVDINLYPYHVAYGTNCGGAIIDKKWVITAGHCGKKPYVRVGSKYVNQGAKISVKHSYIHPEWPAKNKEHPFDYDFQLLELDEELKFGDNIQPIKVAHIEDMVIGKVITVTGWGNTKENGPFSTILRAVRVPIISKENCQHVPFPYFRGGLTARMFCAGYSEGKKDACQGDSGGPAVSYDRLVGMVSFGYGCATPGSFGVYSKVAKVRSWIEEVTGNKLD